jgi:outer membrane protein assembly factor BamB
MHPRTAVAAVLILLVLVGTAALGFTSLTGSSGTLTERWVSNTIRSSLALYTVAVC